MDVHKNVRLQPILPLISAALAVVVISGCVHTREPGMKFGRDEWLRAVERSPVDPAEVIYPFESTPEMKQWVDEILMRYANTGDVSRLDVIQGAMFSKDFDFAYEDDTTLTAAEAFKQRRGNCMSFTALFVAMTRTAQIPTFLMSVRRTPEVEKDEDLVVVNRHVVAGYRNTKDVTVYDFYITTETPFMQQQVIDDVMATAMYHNNLGGDAIRLGRLEAAVSNLAIATALAPNWGPAWVNLGVARFRMGDSEGALEAYQKALMVEPNNSSALTNTAYVYRNMGREDEAQAALRAAAHRTTNPFTLIAIADIEMVRGNLGTAERYLRRARWWYKSEPEVYHALARLARQRGEKAKAEKYEVRAEKLREREAKASSSADG
jgi:Flp pilus assembly protein TadD